MKPHNADHRAQSSLQKIFLLGFSNTCWFLNSWIFKRVWSGFNPSFFPDVLPHNILGFVIWLKAYLCFWLVKEPSQSAVLRVRSTKYPPNLHHLSGKTIPGVLELLPKSEHHEPFGFSALNSQERFSLNKHDKFAAVFTVVWQWVQLPPVFKGVGDHLYHQIHEGSQK